MNARIIKIFSFPAVIRRLLLSWLISTTVTYSILPVNLSSLQSLDALQQLSLSAQLVLWAIFFIAFHIIRIFRNFERIERWLFVPVFSVLSFFSLKNNFSIPFLVLCMLLLFILICYALKGWNPKHTIPITNQKVPFIYIISLVGIVSIFTIFVSVWTVYRVYSFGTPTFDFGIFSQMFYNMKTSGLPMTTVERDGLLSHFHVHVSPIYYLLLPIYWLAPFPATLQVLQAIILASAVIPLWKICQNHNLKPWLCLLICCLLLLYPAYSGGTSYDFHENAFLTPLVLWLFFFIEKKNTAGILLFSLLTLLVKEDAAVYVAVIGLYLLVSACLTTNDRSWGIVTGSSILIGAVIYFLCVTNFLETQGDGVMTYRYQNFMYNGSDSLLTVVKAVIICPMKALYECVNPEKVPFIIQTMLPLLGLPLLTRKYQRYLLLIPYLLINLMSDYTYQHDIFFQYTFGSTAFLFYLTALNLSDLAGGWQKIPIVLAAIIISFSFFTTDIFPKAKFYWTDYHANKYQYAQMRDMMSSIPADASVAASTFYTTHLSQRETLYDVKYAAWEHITSVQYIVLDPKSNTSYKNYAAGNENGYENFTSLLVEYGYTVLTQLDDSVVIYHKTK